MRSTCLQDELDGFGQSIACLGDVDDNGRTDLLAGAIGDDAGGPNAGALWVLCRRPLDEEDSRR